MQIGMIGLGRMGASMTERILEGGHAVTGFDQKPEARNYILEYGAQAVESLEALVKALPPPRILWMMVPSGDPVRETVNVLTTLLSAGDIIIDGGNSNYKDTLRRAEQVATRNIAYVDCGTSGGVWGRKEGYSMMIGGDADVIASLAPIFETLAPARDKGWGRVGPCGAGHFVKMIHNGIEYGMMQAYAEGFALMQHKQEFGLDLQGIAEIWQHGSVVRSWLLDLTGAALAANPQLDGIAPYVEDSGEGRWTVSEAIDLNVAAPVITLALITRLRSRDAGSFSDRLVAAMRHAFGGHGLKKE